MGPGARYALAAASLIVTAAVVRLPALFTGFAADDVAQLAMEQGRFPASRAAWDRFTFSDGDPAEVQRLRDVGYFPWWAADDLRLSLLRPLPSLFVGADHAIFGAQPLGPHLHSLAWWLLLCGLVAWLLVRLLPPRLAWLSLLVYVADTSHTTALGWLANRNSVMASVFCVVAFGAYLRTHPQGGASPEAGTGRARTTMVVAALLAFACGEYAFTFLGYFVTHALLCARGPGRLRALWPLGLGAVGLLVARGLGGMSARGSGGYVEPLSDPLRFGAAALLRLPALAGDALLSLPSDHLSQGFPQAAGWHAAGLASRQAVFDPAATAPLVVGVGLLGLVAGASYLWMCRRDGRHGRTATWAVLGALWSLLPLCGSLPASRHMLATQLGVAVLCALTLERCMAWVRAGGLRVLGPLLLGGLILWTQVWVAGRMSIDGAPMLAGYAGATREAALGLPAEPPLPGRRLYIVASDDPVLSIYVPMLRALHGLPRPRSVHVLSGSPYPVVLRRSGTHSLSLSYLFGGSMLVGAFERIFRSEDRPLRVGDVTRVPGLTVTVAAVDGRSRPTALDFAFEHDLDDPRVGLLRQTPAFSLVPLPPPPVGKSTVVSLRPLR